MSSMITKEIKYNRHYDDVRGDFYGRHTAQHQLQWQFWLMCLSFSQKAINNSR